MLWIKAFHIFFMVTWLASLLYVPRLLVYHCEVKDDEGHARFCAMEKRLYMMGNIGMIGTWVLGIAMLTMWMSDGVAIGKMGWLHAKLTLVFILSGYHGWLKGRLRAFENKTNTKPASFYRVANEVPAVILLVVVILVVVKPF